MIVEPTGGQHTTLSASQTISSHRHKTGTQTKRPPSPLATGENDGVSSDNTARRPPAQLVADTPARPNLQNDQLRVNRAQACDPKIAYLAERAVSIEHIPAFKKGLWEIYEQRNRYINAGGDQYDAIDKSARLFDAYILSKIEEDWHKAMRKIAALVYEVLYGTTPISEAVVKAICQQRHLAPSTVRDHAKTFRQLGRGCHCLVERLGYGCLLLLDEKVIKSWGTIKELDSNKTILDQNSSWLNDTPKFKEQCPKLDGFTKKLVDDFKNGQIWQAVARNSNHATPDTASLQHVQHNTSVSWCHGSWRNYCTYSAPTQWHEGTSPTSRLHSQSAALGVLAGRARYPHDDPVVKLCCFLADAPVPISLLRRGSASKRRWNEFGEVEEFTPVEAGIEREIIACLADDINRNRAVEYLASKSSESYSSEDPSFLINQELKNQVIQRMDDQEKENWRRQAFLIVIQGFPRPFLDPEYHVLGPLHLSHLLSTPDLLEKHRQTEVLSEAQRLEASTAFLAASELPGRAKSIALEQAILFSQNLNDEIVRVDIAQRRSTLLRLKNEVPKSDEVLDEILHTGGLQEETPRWHAQLGYLQLSQALNLMQRECLVNAIDLLQTWKPVNVEKPSTMERVVVFKINTNLGKLLRYRGQLEIARTCLEQTFKETRDDVMFKGSLTDLVCNLGDTLLDQGEPTIAKDLFQAELKSLDTRRKRGSPGSQMLLLSLAECYIQQHLIDDAESIYLDLARKVKIGTVADLRCTIGLARVSHVRSRWEDAQAKWAEALRLVNTNFGLGDTNNPYTALAILESMDGVLSELGSNDLAKDNMCMMNQLETTCSSEGCKHWIPGFTTQWLATLRNPQRMGQLAYTSGTSRSQERDLNDTMDVT